MPTFNMKGISSSVGAKTWVAPPPEKVFLERDISNAKAQKVREEQLLEAQQEEGRELRKEREETRHIRARRLSAGRLPPRRGFKVGVPGGDIGGYRGRPVPRRLSSLDLAAPRYERAQLGMAAARQAEAMKLRSIREAQQMRQFELQQATINANNMREMQYQQERVLAAQEELRRIQGQEQMRERTLSASSPYGSAFGSPYGSPYESSYSYAAGQTYPSLFPGGSPESGFRSSYPYDDPREESGRFNGIDFGIGDEEGLCEIINLA